MEQLDVQVLETLIFFSLPYTIKWQTSQTPFPYPIKEKWDQSFIGETWWSWQWWEGLGMDCHLHKALGILMKRIMMMFWATKSKLNSYSKRSLEGLCHLQRWPFKCIINVSCNILFLFFPFNQYWFFYIHFFIISYMIHYLMNME